MRTLQIIISSFFLICLFNVALIPQICINAIEKLQEKATTHKILGEESAKGLNIFEEENKESSSENKEEKSDGPNLKYIGIFRNAVHRIINQSLLANSFQIDYYQSIPVLKITPPPKA